MADVCRTCNRSKTEVITDPKTGAKRRTRRKDHKCDIAVVRDLKKSERDPLSPYDITVHSDRIEKGGDLHKKVTGKNPPMEVMFRSRTKIEKLSERKGNKRTRGSQKKSTSKKKEKASK